MAVTIVRDRNGTSLANTKRMYLKAETSAITLSVPYAPREIDYGGWAQDWAEAERSGDRPLLLRKGEKLDTLGFAFRLVDVDRLQSQTALIARIRQLAKTRERVMVRFGPNEAGLWRVTDVAISSTQRHPVTNEITDAIVNLTLTGASDAAPAVGAVKPPPPKPPPPKPPPPRTYVVKRGDCLWRIAQRYYGQGSKWPRIYDANRKQIKNPHWIYPGQRFVIPS